jgi:hypothetical protein
LKQDVSFNPDRQFTHQDLRVAFARPHSAKRGCKRFLLLRSGELGDQQSMADGDLVFEKCLGHGGYKVSESDTTVDVSLALSCSRRDIGNRVGRFSEFQE